MVVVEVVVVEVVVVEVEVTASAGNSKVPLQQAVVVLPLQPLLAPSQRGTGTATRGMQRQEQQQQRLQQRGLAASLSHDGAPTPHLPLP